MQSSVDHTLQRARDRLGQLSGEIEQWIATQKAPLHHSADADTGTHEWRIEAPAGVPAELSQGAGEVVTELRAALDEAARDAAGNAGASPEQQQTISFPLTTSAAEFEQVAPQQLGGAPDALRAAIDAYQLYQVPPTPIVANLGVLWRLAGLVQRGALDGQVILATGVDPRSIEVTAGKEGASANVTAGAGVGRPANGAVALRIEVSPPDTPIQVTPFDPPALLVAFGDDTSRVAIPDLQNLVATVMRIQAELAQLTAPAPADAPQG